MLSIIIASLMKTPLTEVLSSATNGSRLYLTESVNDEYLFILLCMKFCLLPRYIIDSLGKIPGSIGLFSAAVYSAGISTLSASFSAISAVIVKDAWIMYCSRSGKSIINEEKLVTVTRVMPIILASITIGLSMLCSHITSIILEVAFIVFGAVGGPVLGSFVVGFFMPSIKGRAACIGLLLSTIVCFSISIGSTLLKVFLIIYKSSDYVRAVRLPVSNSCRNATIIEFDISSFGLVSTVNSINFELIFFKIESLKIIYLYSKYTTFSTDLELVLIEDHLIVSQKIAFQDLFRYVYINYLIFKNIYVGQLSPVTNEGIPSLESVVMWAVDNKIKMLFDVKDSDTELVSIIANLFEKYQLYDKAIVCSFYPWVVHRVKQGNQKILTGLTWRQKFFSYHDIENKRPRYSGIKHYVFVVIDIFHVSLLKTVTPWFLGADLLLTNNLDISKWVCCNLCRGSCIKMITLR
uniref:Na_H_antiporter domain-containing protein n=1 Tax=Heterorhabditis bacteriophora TaxID=37862 RepID=A0A1I7WEQ9_HETBA